jgi:hypothetical protein
MSAVTCLLVAVVPLLAAGRVSASPACETTLPSNVDAGMLHPIVVGLLRRSWTFRQQCQRIAATRRLRIAIHVGNSIEEGARAQTVIGRYEAGGLRADVTVRFSEDYLELVAHEFEHVLEQVDGVNLQDEVASGRAWRTASGAFETRRAFNAGVRARQECDGLAPVAIQMDAGKPPAARHPIY